jgi:lysozyme
MEKQRIINKEGLELIKSHEGLRLETYLCPAGFPTIGYGHLIKEGESFDVITEKEAEALLLEDIQDAAEAVDRFVEVELNENQRAALISFTFNLGAGAFRRSTLRKKLNEGDFEAAAVEFDRWVFAGGEPLPGLVKRRAEERELFLKPHLKPIAQSKTLAGAAVVTAGAASSQSIPEWAFLALIAVGVAIVVASRLIDRKKGRV